MKGQKLRLAVGGIGSGHNANRTIERVGLSGGNMKAWCLEKSSPGRILELVKTRMIRNR